MQLEHWQLAESPFSTLLDTRHYYPSASHDEALARLEYLVDARRRLGVLVGEGGIGKSLVLRTAAEQLARSGAAVATIDVAGAGTREFLWQLAAALGAAPRDSVDVVQLWRQIADCLAENRLQQKSTILMVDNAGEAGPDVLTQIARLARLESSPDARWTIVLAAVPAEAARWNESLREQVDLRVDLEPWDEAETIGYIQTALVDAGRCDPVFLEEALLAIYALTRGVPRRVVRLAELALIAGAAAGVERIDAELVHASNGEMSWPTLETASY
jgi:type II secretory pathway predicted ATPase ExeA